MSCAAFCLKSLLMPFGDLPFCLKPIGQVVPVFTVSSLPKFMCPPGNLLFQAHVFVHHQDRCGRLEFSCPFHKHIVVIFDFSKRQLRPKNPAYRLRSIFVSEAILRESGAFIRVVAGDASSVA